MSEPPLMDLAAFQDEGYLAEVNRQLLHPLGLALAVMVDDDGVTTGWGVYDDRADLEGWKFGDDSLAEVEAKAGNVRLQWEARRPFREAALGYMVQPTGAVAVDGV